MKKKYVHRKKMSGYFKHGSGYFNSPEFKKDTGRLDKWRKEKEAHKKDESDGRKVALVDVDETICFYEDDDRDYKDAIPLVDNIEKINKLYDEGWYIIYWTARGGSQKSKAKNKCYHEFTRMQLLNWGCKFQELSTGSQGNYIKPPNDLIIDDKAIRIEELGEMTMGRDKAKPKREKKKPKKDKKKKDK
jgi:hypothetical protein